MIRLAGKGVLSDFKAEYETSGISSVLKLLSSQLGERLSAINPLYTNKVDKDHLYDPKFHKHAFDYRTKRLTYTLAMRIRDYNKKGVPPYQAFLKVQTHLMALGKAYMPLSQNLRIKWPMKNTVFYSKNQVFCMGYTKLARMPVGIWEEQNPRQLDNE